MGLPRKLRWTFNLANPGPSQQVLLGKHVFFPCFSSPFSIVWSVYALGDGLECH